MPEISAQDLRRLQALEGRVERAQSEKRSFAAERRELRARAAAAERAARTAEKHALQREERLTSLVEENAKLAARLDEVGADSDRLRDAALGLREEVDSAQRTVQATSLEAERLARALQKAESERDGVAERLKLAEAQLKTQTTTPLLPAKEVAKLIDGFIGEIGAGLPGMVVRDGEVRLQVAFGQVGGGTGFVVPSADSPPEVRKNLHEVSVRFDRAAEIAEPQE